MKSFRILTFRVGPLIMKDKEEKLKTDFLDNSGFRIKLPPIELPVNSIENYLKDVDC